VIKAFSELQKCLIALSTDFIDNILHDPSFRLAGFTKEPLRFLATMHEGIESAFKII
jgi:hypothetical protein